MISVSNLIRKSFRLYLEMKIRSLINLYAIRLYLETDKCPSLISISNSDFSYSDCEYHDLWDLVLDGPARLVY